MQSTLRIDWEKHSARYNFPLFTFAARDQESFDHTMQHAPKHKDLTFVIEGWTATAWVDLDFAKLGKMQHTLDLENGPFSLAAQVDKETTKKIVAEQIAAEIAAVLEDVKLSMRSRIINPKPEGE